MRDKNPILKITRPRFSAVLPRKRLFRLLDQNRKSPVTWVSGPGGSGKTVLAASWIDAKKLPCIWYRLDEGDGDIASFFYYIGLAAKKAAPRHKKNLPLLTPECLPGIATFTRRYFEELYAGLKPPTVLVFDNYQDAPVPAPLHETIKHGLSSLPPGMHVIILSRGEPPAAFADLRAKNGMQFIDANDLRLTLDESKRIIRRKVKHRLSEEALTELHDRAEGWAAGVVLLTERAILDADGPGPASFHSGKVFDYFAGEILNKLDSETRDFLLTSSFLPTLTVQSAIDLTGVERAGQILLDLTRNGFFTERHAAPLLFFRYHPLFREFLQARMKASLSPEGLVRWQKRTGEILKKSGQTSDAIELLIEAREWNAFVVLVLEQAPALVRQGRFQTLETWLNRCPEEIYENVPWLLYWKGVCRMPFDPGAGRNLLEKAFGLFKAANDAIGLFLSCSTIAKTYIYELDDFLPLTRWIRELDDLLKQYGGIPSKEIEPYVTYAMFWMLIFHQPYRPDIQQWADRLHAVMCDCPDYNDRIMTGLALILYDSWIGDYTKYQTIIDELSPFVARPEIAPMTKIMWYMTEAIYQWATARFDKCEEFIAKGIETANETGVHTFDSMLYSQGVYNALIAGDLDASAEYVKKMALTTDMSKQFLASHYNYHKSWDALSRGDLSTALPCCRKACTLGTGWYFRRGVTAVLAAQVLFEAGETAEAAHFLVEARNVAVSMKSRKLEFDCLLLESYFSYASKTRKDEERGGTALKKAMELGRKTNEMNLNGLKRSTTAFLCAKALETGIETVYVGRLIAAHRLMPEGPPLHIENWPWPFRIYTLGAFRIEKDGRPLYFSGKVQKKPIELLKILVARGGKDVSEERIAEALWPDAEGDKALNSLETTLHRLRRLLGNEKVVLRQKGRLTLDAKYWWSDAWAFERMLDEALASKDEEYREKAMHLYGGAFLAEDGEQSWLLSARMRLRSAFLRLVSDVGKSYERSGQTDKALDCWLKALAADHLAEEFYERLMLCYQRHGRKAEAVTVYKQCRTALMAAFGMEPSEKMQVLYHALVQEARR